MKVVRKENEEVEALIKRFKKQTQKSGVLDECRKRKFFLKKSLARKRKSEQARRRMKSKKR